MLLRSEEGLTLETSAIVISTAFHDQLLEQHRVFYRIADQHQLVLLRTGEPFHSQQWSSSDFSCRLTSNITSYSTKNLTFHSLLRLKDD